MTTTTTYDNFAMVTTKGKQLVQDDTDNTLSQTQQYRFFLMCKQQNDALVALANKYDALLGVYWNDHDDEASVTIMSKKSERKGGGKFLTQRIPLPKALHTIPNAAQS
jgi:hypothetical protein